MPNPDYMDGQNEIKLAHASGDPVDRHQHR